MFYKLYFAVLYIVLAPIWMSFFYKYWVRVFSDTIPLAIYSAPLVIVLTSIAMMTSGAIDGLVPGYDYPIKWTSYLVNLSAVHIVETIAFVWLLPKLREELAEIEDATGKRPLVEYAIINGRSVPLSQIKMVQSAEHYLIVATDNGSTEYRARLKDFLEQVTPEHGIQTHRSHWISTAEALSLFGNTVKTRSGEDVPVSRGRYEEVRQWFRKMGKPF